MSIAPEWKTEWTFDENAIPSPASMRLEYSTDTLSITRISVEIASEDSYLRSSSLNARRLDEAMREVFGE